MGAWASTEHKSQQPCDNCEAEQRRGIRQEGPSLSHSLQVWLRVTVLTEGMRGPPRGVVKARGLEPFLRGRPT